MMILRLADKIIQVNNIYPFVQDYCKKYLIKDTPESVDYIVTVFQEDIDFERMKSEAEDIFQGREVRIYTDSYLETLAVYRKVADALSDSDTILFHGSCIAVDEEGYIFAAQSGVGKSTHARLWKKCFGSRSRIINDDKPLIKITENGAFAYGTPWDGKHRINSDSCVKLKAICILGRGKENIVYEVDSRKKFDMLVQQSHRSDNPQKTVKILKLIKQLEKTTKIYGIECNTKDEAPIEIFKGINNLIE